MPGPFGAGVKVDETLVHDRGALAQIGPQSHSGGVGDAHASRHNVVRHFGEFIDAGDFEYRPFEPRVQLPLRKLLQVDGSLICPRDIG